ncbi:MAG: hypothetical protein HZA59_06635 [Hydrogenophilales bacterium]|nr:hypothetical protein [Hydrogenophilales bacterium]
MNETTNDPAVEAAEAAVEGAAPPRTQRDGAPRSSHRHTERSGHGMPSKKSQRLMLAVALAISLLLLLVFSVIAGIRIDAITKEAQIAQAELFQTKQALAKTIPELEQARKELSNQIKGKFPHLLELAPDKVIKLDTGYVKNIVFTVLQKNGKPLYEYRLVMENMSDSMVRPDARVFVFDHRGAQIGMGEIADRGEMAPGESRSYSSTVERFIEVEPRYFYVWTRGKGRAEVPSK